MLTRSGTVDPTDVAALQQAVDESDPEGRLTRIGLRRIEIGETALDELSGAIASVSNRSSVTVIMDRTPIRRNGQDLKQSVIETLARSFDVVPCWLSSPGEELHADEQVISQAAAAAAGTGCVVAVGSGTITDVAKEASARLENVPLVVVQTAASVNAFSDNMAVLLRSGVKRTVASRWPDVLLVDLEILAAAPRAMNLAGFGDLLAIWTAPADWKLASFVGMDGSYHPCPIGLVRTQSELLLQSAPALASGSLGALDRLAVTLTLSGIALGIAGSTAPLSGTEHLISHLIDMRATCQNEPLRLHGAQVGLAAVIAAELWTRFLAQVGGAPLGLDASPVSEDAVKRVVLSAFSDLDRSGSIGTECWGDCRRKLIKWTNRRQEGATSSSADWNALRFELASDVPAPDELVRVLRDAGAVTSFANLDPPVPREAVRWAIERLPFMRERFTLADLLFYSGRWDERLIDDVFNSLDELGVLA
jgi:glycerol-1-phosphate dehydrogenase [NAD(P)+]